ADCLEVLPPAQNPDCTAEGLCGASFCSPRCNENECEEGFYPAQVGDDCYCIPREIGRAGPGDPCPHSGANRDADYCQSGLECLGVYPVQLTTLCTSDADCMDVMPPAQNPDCTADGICGASFCAPPCDENAECEPGFYPARVGNDCYCIPQEIGSSGPGDPCPFQGVHADADDCQAGLLCLGIYPDGHTTLCETDVDCMDVFPPAENPACSDEGLCGESFCSAFCDENNQCEPGFYPAVVGEDCYCIPE
ncbi:MAG: hypothetical protein JXR96_02515, partial [Deltaproteobacteria bacterium]|nr:hypothetical protein [Deltaproteobacteria bacterium]